MMMVAAYFPCPPARADNLGLCDAAEILLSLLARTGYVHSITA
jgi:hypothetical protein